KGRRDVLRFFHIRPADTELSIHHRRIVEENVLFAFTGAALAYELERLPRQPLGQFLRVGDGGGSANELRLAAVELADAGETAEKIRQMAAEHSPIHVQLIDDNKFDVL